MYVLRSLTRQLKKEVGKAEVFWAAAFLLVNFGLIQTGQASNNYVMRADSAVKALYGATAGFGGSCTTCHGDMQPQIPAGGFGSLFRSNGGAGGNSIQIAQFQTIFTAIKDLDADNDTFSNEKEFMGNSDPGDPLSKPGTAPVATPTPPVVPTPSSDSGKQSTSSFSPNVVGGCGSSSGSTGYVQASLFESMISVVFVLAPLFIVWGLRKPRDKVAVRER